MITTDIKIDHEYSVVELNILLPPHIIDWLTDRLGDGADGRWLYHNAKLYFANATDHLMFVMRWP
jgi:hypothetical protein